MATGVELDDATGVVLLSGSTDLCGVTGVGVESVGARGCGGGINDEAGVDFDGSSGTGVGSGVAGDGGTCGTSGASVLSVPKNSE